jgi:hypothetical protein
MNHVCFEEIEVGLCHHKHIATHCILQPIMTQYYNLEIKIYRNHFKVIQNLNLVKVL